MARYLEHMEQQTPQPSIRLTVSILLSESELVQASQVIAQSFAAIDEQFQKGLI